MTLTTMLIRVAIAAAILMAIIWFIKKDEKKNPIMMYAQYFCGVLFLFSGWVKAVDPLGTAYKMEQYFDEFELTFSETAMSFIAPIFPALGNMSIGFSVFMIVFEIVLALMLIMGSRPRWTSWLFFGLVIFFTILTGFTYLTGYVPSGGNFFDFGAWTAFNENNMRVKDCGCFGDFIKLKPFTSFMKDIFLLIPAFYFLFKNKEMVQLFTPKVRNIILGLSTVGLLLYCFSNYVWDIPHADFRPFQKGRDIAAQREIEMDAQANVDVYAWQLKERSTGAIIEIPTEQYFAGLTSTYSRDKYEVVEQLKTKPSIEPSKISEFEITDLEGNDVSYDYLDNEQAHFLIVSHKPAVKAKPTQVPVKDTIYRVDTLMIDDVPTPTRSVDRIEDKVVTKNIYTWDDDYIHTIQEKIIPLAKAAKSKGAGVSFVAGSVGPEVLMDLQKVSGLDVDYRMADDILLKTIVRSNPGVVLWKDGKILDKWHENKLPNFSEIAAEHLR